MNDPLPLLMEWLATAPALAAVAAWERPPWPPADAPAALTGYLTYGALRVPEEADRAGPRAEQEVAIVLLAQLPAGAAPSADWRAAARALPLALARLRVGEWAVGSVELPTPCDYAAAAQGVFRAECRATLVAAVEDIEEDE